MANFGIFLGTKSLDIDIPIKIVGDKDDFTIEKPQSKIDNLVEPQRKKKEKNNDAQWLDRLHNAFYSR